MYSHSSCEAWDLLWAIPDEAVVEPPPVAAKTGVVRRVAPRVVGEASCQPVSLSFRVQKVSNQLSNDVRYHSGEQESGISSPEYGALLPSAAKNAEPAQLSLGYAGVLSSSSSDAVRTIRSAAEVLELPATISATDLPCVAAKPSSTSECGDRLNPATTTASSPRPRSLSSSPHVTPALNPPSTQPPLSAAAPTSSVDSAGGDEFPTGQPDVVPVSSLRKDMPIKVASSRCSSSIVAVFGDGTGTGFPSPAPPAKACHDDCRTAQQPGWMSACPWEPQPSAGGAAAVPGSSWVELGRRGGGGAVQSSERALPPPGVPQASAVPVATAAAVSPACSEGSCDEVPAAVLIPAVHTAGPVEAPDGPTPLAAEPALQQAPAVVAFWSAAALRQRLRSRDPRLPRRPGGPGELAAVLRARQPPQAAATPQATEDQPVGGCGSSDRPPGSQHGSLNRASVPGASQVTAAPAAAAVAGGGGGRGDTCPGDVVNHPQEGTVAPPEAHRDRRGGLASVPEAAGKPPAPPRPVQNLPPLRRGPATTTSRLLASLRPERPPPGPTVKRGRPRQVYTAGGVVEPQSRGASRSSAAGCEGTLQPKGGRVQKAGPASGGSVVNPTLEPLDAADGSGCDDGTAVYDDGVGVARPYGGATCLLDALEAALKAAETPLPARCSEAGAESGARVAACSEGVPRCSVPLQQRPAAVTSYAAVPAAAPGAARRPKRPAPLPGPPRGRFDFRPRRRRPRAFAPGTSLPSAGGMEASGRMAARMLDGQEGDFPESEQGSPPGAGGKKAPAYGLSAGAYFAPSALDDAFFADHPAPASNLISQQQPTSRKLTAAVADGAASAASAPISPREALLAAIDAWRKARARSVHKTAESFLRSDLMGELTRRCPTSVLCLEDVPGLARPWVRQYGQEVLDLCRNHVHLQAAAAAAAARERVSRPVQGTSAAAMAAAAGGVEGRQQPVLQSWGPDCYEPSLRGRSGVDGRAAHPAHQLVRAAESQDVGQEAELEQEDRGASRKPRRSRDWPRDPLDGAASHHDEGGSVKRSRLVRPGPGSAPVGMPQLGDEGTLGRGDGCRTTTGSGGRAEEQVWRRSAAAGLGQGSSAVGAAAAGGAAAAAIAVRPAAGDDARARMRRQLLNILGLQDGPCLEDQLLADQPGGSFEFGSGEWAGGRARIKRQRLVPGPWGRHDEATGQMPGGGCGAESGPTGAGAAEIANEAATAEDARACSPSPPGGLATAAEADGSGSLAAGVVPRHNVPQNVMPLPYDGGAQQPLHAPAVAKLGVPDWELRPEDSLSSPEQPAPQAASVEGAAADAAVTAVLHDTLADDLTGRETGAEAGATAAPAVLSSDDETMGAVAARPGRRARQPKRRWEDENEESEGEGDGQRRVQSHAAAKGRKASTGAKRATAAPTAATLARAAKAAAKKAAKAEATAAAAAAAAALPSSGWVPPPDTCRVRSGLRLAYAHTPAVHSIRVNDLLGMLAEAGLAAEPFLDQTAGPQAVTSAGGSHGAAHRHSRSHRPAGVSDATTALTPATGFLPAAAVATAAAAAQTTSRPAAAEHLRRLRAMAAAALPAWEVQRVLACRVLAADTQAAAVLRVPMDASRDDARVAFRRLSLLVHPDKNRSPGAAEAFSLVSSAAGKLLGKAG